MPLLVCLVHAPDLVNGPGGVQQRDRWIKLQGKLGYVVRRQAAQLGRIEGHTYLGVQGHVHSPFEPSHVRQVCQVATRRKGRQESWKMRTILEQAWRLRRILPDVRISGIAEKPFVY